AAPAAGPPLPLARHRTLLPRRWPPLLLGANIFTHDARSGTRSHHRLPITKALWDNHRSCGRGRRQVRTCPQGDPGIFGRGVLPDHRIALQRPVDRAPWDIRATIQPVLPELTDHADTLLQDHPTVHYLGHMTQ